MLFFYAEYSKYFLKEVFNTTRKEAIPTIDTTVVTVITLFYNKVVFNIDAPSR